VTIKRRRRENINPRCTYTAKKWNAKKDLAAAVAAAVVIAVAVLISNIIPSDCLQNRLGAKK
jgi:hypothetical protein